MLVKWINTDWHEILLLSANIFICSSVWYQVESQFQNLQGTGSQTLALVNRSITQVNSSMMCFANAKKTVDNATLLAQSAQNSSSHSLMVSLQYFFQYYLIAQFLIYFSFLIMRCCALWRMCYRLKLTQ